jgi:pilus assembly protein CpaE
MAQRILVVDDDPDTLTLIGLTLHRRGFEVLKAQSGAQALNMLTHDVPDLIILDVMMPQMDGFEVCRQLKARPALAHLPVVMLTAKAQTASQLEGFRAGAVDYITKPVHPQDLVNRIQAVLEKSARISPLPNTHVISVLGAKGGVGATTLAVNLAVTAAARHSTLLVDFDPAGSAGLHLGLESRGLDALLSDDTAVVETNAVEEALAAHSSGLRVLTAANKPATAAQTSAILNITQALGDVCVFDLGSGLSAAGRVIAPRSQVVLLVIDADRATLQQAARLLHALSDSGVSAGAVRLIWINRHNAPIDIAQPAIRSMLGSDPAALIDAAPEAMYAAMEHGRPLVLDQADDPVAREIKELARRLLPQLESA